MELVFGLLSGVVKGNLVGKLLCGIGFDLGPWINSLVGVLGAAISGSLLMALGAPMVEGAVGDVAGLDFGVLVGQIAFGGVGGGIALVMVGGARNALAA